MAKSTSRKTGRSGGSSIFTGVLIGLVVGAVLSVGVALWVTDNNPFKLAEPAKITPPQGHLSSLIHPSSFLSHPPFFFLHSFSLLA